MKYSKEYLDCVLENTPRLLGLLNRNPLSKTYGCFDRQFWQYNTCDTPSVRCQEAVLTLALLYVTEGTPYYQNKLILEWINAGTSFWLSIQENNGSFNEWYPNENSFVATAFSCYAISETLLLLKDKIHNNETVKKALTKACNWLLSKKEKRVQNQESGTLIAIYNTFLLTNNKKFSTGAKKLVESIAKSQTNEGWFYEYGGADIGYLSLTIDYLVKYYKKSGDKTAKDIIEHGIDFISYFVHPNLTFGGEYGSRNTEYLIPGGFEMIAGQNKVAASVAKCIRLSLDKKSSVSPYSLDDRYLTYITYNWLQAYISSSKLNAEKNKFHEWFSKDFKLAQIFIKSTDHYYLITNYGKGGSFKLFFKKSQKSIYDGGILAKTNKGLMSGHLSSNFSEIKDGKISVMGHMSEIKDSTLSPFSTVLLRLFQMTFGRSESVGQFIKEKLRDKLVTNAKKSNVKFSREICFDELKIIDSLTGDNLQMAIIGSKHSYAYTPSSRYFQLSDLENNPFSIEARGFSRIDITRTFNEEGNVKYSVENQNVQGGNLVE